MGTARSRPKGAPKTLRPSGANQAGTEPYSFRLPLLPGSSCFPPRLLYHSRSRRCRHDPAALLRPPASEAMRHARLRGRSGEARSKGWCFLRLRRGGSPAPPRARPRSCALCPVSSSRSASPTSSPASPPASPRSPRASASPPRTSRARRRAWGCSCLPAPSTSRGSQPASHTPAGESGVQGHSAPEHTQIVHCAGGGGHGRQTSAPPPPGSRWCTAMSQIKAYITYRRPSRCSSTPSAIRSSSRTKSTGSSPLLEKSPRRCRRTWSGFFRKYLTLLDTRGRGRYCKRANMPRGGSWDNQCRYYSKVLSRVAEPLISDWNKESLTETPKSMYTGGDFRRAAESDMTHVALAFEMPGGWLQDRDATVNRCTDLNGQWWLILLWWSWKRDVFTALVLTKYHDVQAFSAFSNVYDNGGLFGIYLTTPPDFVAKAVDVAIRDLIAIATPGQVTEVELTRAKNSTISSVVMNLESRVIVAEDIGRQLLTYGCRKPIDHFLQCTDELILDDITTFAAKLLSSQPTVASYGDVDKVPP